MEWGCLAVGTGYLSDIGRWWMEVVHKMFCMCDVIALYCQPWICRYSWQPPPSQLLHVWNCVTLCCGWYKIQSVASQDIVPVPSNWLDWCVVPALSPTTTTSWLHSTGSVHWLVVSDELADITLKLPMQAKNTSLQSLWSGLPAPAGGYHCSRATRVQEGA